MQIEEAARVLARCSGARLSVSEVVTAMGRGHDNTIALIRELKEHGLLAQEIAREALVGRPRQYLRVTSLGRRFVAEYERLRKLPLLSNGNDVRKALHQAELARTLIESGISPYERFQELNQIARNIQRTAKAQRRAR